MENLKFEFTVEEVNLLLSALSEMPYKVVNNLLVKITNHANDQVNAHVNNTKEQEYNQTK